MRILFVAAIIALLAVSGAVAGAELLTGTVASTGADENAIYVFTVTYKGDTAPGVVSVIINDVPRPMLEMDPNDTNYSDGKTYYLETRLEPGVNIYSFSSADATAQAKMVLVKEAEPFTLTHLDIMFAVLVFVPFVVYFIHLTRKMTKALERIDRREERKEGK